METHIMASKLIWLALAALALAARTRTGVGDRAASR